MLKICLVESCTVVYNIHFFQPDWSSIDSRPIPEWYNNAKLGIFAHWGVYSVPAYHSEWFWYYWKTEKQPAFQEFVLKYYRNDTTYADFAKDVLKIFFFI